MISEKYPEDWFREEKISCATRGKGEHCMTPAQAASKETSLRTTFYTLPLICARKFACLRDSENPP